MHPLSENWINFGARSNEPKKGQNNRPKRVWIALNNPELSRHWRPPLGPEHFATIIAVDGGFDLLQKWGVICHLFIGDGDSLKGELPPEIPRRWLAKDKSASDFECLLRRFPSLLQRPLFITGLLGSRFDHAFFNARVLLRAPLGYPALFSGKLGNGLILPPGTHQLDLGELKTFSLIFDQIPREMELSGCKFPFKKTENRRTPQLQTLFLSNETVAGHPIHLRFSGRGNILIYGLERRGV